MMTPIQTVRANSYQTYISDDCRFKVDTFVWTDEKLHISYEHYEYGTWWHGGYKIAEPEQEAELIAEYEQAYLTNELYKLSDN